jgi:hypothetical protein
MMRVNDDQDYHDAYNHLWSFFIVQDCHFCLFAEGDVGAAPTSELIFVF